MKVMAERVEAVLIAGPTASGKSALALGLARSFGGTVINADSMQVYRDLRVLTARPTPVEEASAPHRLYGEIDGAMNYSVGRYVEDAGRALAEERAAGRLPIVIGGTGLYFKALLEGLSAIPPVSDEVRTALRRETEALTSPELHARLAARDPDAAAALRPGDRLRVLRALEVLGATGRSILSFHGSRQPGPLAGAACIKVFLAAEREALRRRIDARFERMIGEGALEEVRALADRGLDPMLPIMRAHGVPGLVAHLKGRSTLDEAIVRGQADTRRYAKRQATWFRHQAGPDWLWLGPEDAHAAVARALAGR
jgi:tRNA dimethylallyltransferase